MWRFEKKRLAQAEHQIWGVEELKESEETSRALRACRNTIVFLEGNLDKVNVLLNNSSEREELSSLEAEKMQLEDRLEHARRLERRCIVENESRVYRLFQSMLERVTSRIDRNPEGQRARFLREELRAMFAIPEIDQSLADSFLDEEGIFDPYKLFVELGKPDTELTADILYKVVGVHVERIKERAERAEQLVEEYKQDFMRRLKEEVAKGGLSIDPDMIDRRLALMVGRVVDCMRKPSFLLASHGAEGVVEISSSEIENDRNPYPFLRHAIFHEFTHEVAGKSIRLITTTRYGSVEQKVSDRKTGVRILDGSSKSIVRRFTWLNEAITEWYSLRLSGYQENQDSEREVYKGSHCYMLERQELDRLFALGLSEDLVLDAYFEDIHEGQSKDKRGLAFAALLKKINELEKDPHAFARLENVFTIEAVTTHLAGMGFFLSREVSDEDRAHFLSGRRVYPVTFSVGIRPDTRVTQSLIYVASPNADQEDEHAGFDVTQVRIEEILSRVKLLFGGERCRYAIGEPEVVPKSEESEEFE